MNTKSLTPADLQSAAVLLSVDVPTIMAVCEVEANGSGFFSDGQPKILFEAHIFSNRTQRKYDTLHPDISSPTWNKALYRGGPLEHARLEKAVKLNRDAALSSASWGLFQIMGFNYARAGFATLQEFVNAMYESEGRHLAAFCTFVKSMGLDDELQRHDFDAFAIGFNGPRQAENRYSERLYKSYRRFDDSSTPVS